MCYLGVCLDMFRGDHLHYTVGTSKNRRQTCGGFHHETPRCKQKKKANRQRCDQRPGAQNYRGLRQDGTPKPGGSKLKWPSGLHPRQRWHNAIHGVHLTEHQTYYTETTAAVVCHLSFLKIGEDYAKMKAGPCKVEKTHLEDPRKKHGKWGGTSQK